MVWKEERLGKSARKETVCVCEGVILLYSLVSHVNDFLKFVEEV